MKKILLYVGLVGIAGMVESSAGGGAVASVNSIDKDKAATKIQAMTRGRAARKKVSLLKNQNNDGEIAKRWLKVGINVVQQNIDANKNPLDWSKIDVSKYQHPIDWNQIEKESNRYISADPEFIKKHYQGALSFIAKEGYDELIQGRCLFLDSTNIKEVTEQLQTQLYKDTVTHISVYAADISRGNNVWNIIDVIFQQRPDVTLVVNFEYNSQTNNFEIPDSVKRLIISGRNITSIENNFLGYCIGLTQLDVSSLSNVTQIGNAFLFVCIGLTQLDLSPLSNVTEVGAGFLDYCSGLTQLDLSPLSKLTSVGISFLNHCSGLTQLDLFPLSNVNEIGDGFLARCNGLTQLDLSSLSKVTSVGSYFLFECSGLTQLDLSPLSKVTSVGDFFLDGCSGLKELYLPPHVTSAEGFFLADCDNLITLYLNQKLYEKLGGEAYFSGKTYNDKKRFPKLKLESIHFYNVKSQQQQRAAGGGAVASENKSTKTLGRLSKKQIKKNKKK